MAHILTCPRGHEWEAPSETSSGDAGESFLCPVCSAAFADPPPPRAPLSALEALDEVLAPLPDTLSGPTGNWESDPQRETIAVRAISLPQLAGYEVLSLLGQGGMGVVYKARQIRLNRLVALKMILSGPQANPQELTRFQIEAEAVARLQHPHIVQIYEVGEQEGRPYFALEFVDGGSLERKLDGTPLPAARSAALVETLARAMQYAHEHGVVHRDLKPANVLLTPDGTPKITDFGLAKRLDTDTGQTQTGAIMGTPSYMAPEQAAGQAKAVGPAADVYALGAILYEAITGRPPFKAASVLDTLEQVRTQEPVAPVRLQPRLPRDLETICLRCLEKEPQKRYGSALALAEDLRRFQAGEPIEARPVGTGERVVKWARRRPTAAALVAVSGLAVVSLLLGGLAYQVRLRRALEEAQHERQRAETYFVKAREAVDELLTEVGDELLADVPHLEPLRRSLLEKALKQNQWFLQERSGDPIVQREAARAYGRNARLYEWLGKSGPAEEALRQALAVHQQLVEAQPGEPRARLELAASYDSLGNLLGVTGRVAEAEDAFNKALALCQPLVQGSPDQPSHRAHLAKTLQHRAILHARAGRLDQTKTDLVEALALLERPTTAIPEAEGDRSLKAKVSINLGNLYHQTGQLIEAEAAYEKGRNLLQSLVDERPEARRYRSDLAASCNNLGYLYHATSRPEKAGSVYRQAIAIRTQLTRDFPLVFGYAVDLGGSSCNLANLLRDAGELEQALGCYADAIRTLEAKFQEQPRNAVAREYLRNSHLGRAETFRRMDRDDEANADEKRAQELGAGR
jgi:serine/threonine-protein kinase